MNPKYLFAVITCLICLSLNCGFLSPGPAQTVRNFYYSLENGKIDDAAKLYSAGYLSRHDQRYFKTGLATYPQLIKDEGGISSVNIKKEEVIGDVAEVIAEAKYESGEMAVSAYKLIKENNEWKIDDRIQENK